MEFQSHIRQEFLHRGFSQVETPTLVVSPGLEPYLDVFQTRLQIAGRQEVRYLPTSPEFHLKKLMASGWAHLFEIKKCFRNGEVGPHHQPEFTMLEWYRVGGSLEDLKKDVEELLKSSLDWARQKGLERRCENLQIESQTMASLFNDLLGLSLSPQTSRETLIQWLESLSLHWCEEDSWGDLFFRIFVEKIEPIFKDRQGFFLSDFPPSLSALSEIDAQTGWAQRFEFYYQGVELANAFYELTDFEEQAQRFASEIERKKQLGKKPVPVDEEFMQALKEGLPASAGIALGLDRLFMVAMGLSDIREFHLFPN